MSIFPDARLVRLLAAWTLLAGAGVIAPALAPAALAALPLLAGVVLADAALLRRTPALRLRRHLPERLSVGRAARVELRVENPGPSAAVAEVADEVPHVLADEDAHFALVAIGAGGTRVLRYAVAPRARGDHRFGSAVALQRSRLGLLRRRVRAGADEVAPVAPDASRFLRPEALHPEKVLASLGVKPARRRGEGLEFDSLREYVPGDDPRRIDWRATARRGRLVTRVHRHERSQTLIVALDASRLMGARFDPEGRTKLDHGVDAALALVYAALAAGDRACLAVFDRELRGRLGPRANGRDLGAFVELLRPVASRLVEADYRSLARDLLARWPKRALLVVLTDFVEADATQLVAPLALLARRHRTLLVALRDPSFELLDREPRAAGGLSAAAREELLFRRIVLDDLLREREEVLTRLRRRGLHTLDLRPEAVTARVLDRYLALRYGEAA